ncbi:MAG TPA: carboxylesterase, partial [Aquabacterium sp.]|nr:carboxylesterase [Aquabacterium sp.]
LADTTKAERHDANADTPVFMAHGDADGVVPMTRGQQAYAVLSRLGQPVQWNDYPIDHSVSLDEIADIRDWLRGVWSGEPV